MAQTEAQFKAHFDIDIVTVQAMPEKLSNYLDEMAFAFRLVLLSMKGDISGISCTGNTMELNFKVFIKSGESD
jgi:hypothetical protein